MDDLDIIDGCVEGIFFFAYGLPMQVILRKHLFKMPPFNLFKMASLNFSFLLSAVMTSKVATAL